MPFTFSHPAILLPFCKKKYRNLSSTGLIIGSIAPDLEYFINMKMERIHGHELASILWYQLPICLICALLYQGIVKKPLLHHSPSFIQSRVGHYANKNWMYWFTKHWPHFIVSCIIGILSHLIWDSMTHAHGLFGNNPRILMLNFEHTWGRTYLYEWLQFLSSIIGLIALFLFIYRMKARPFLTAGILNKFNFWFRLLIILVSIVSLKGFTDYPTFIATFISASMIGLVGTSIYQKVYEKFYRKRVEKF